MIIMGKYKVTNKGWIVLACLILLVGLAGLPLLGNQNDSGENDQVEDNNLAAEGKEAPEDNLDTGNDKKPNDMNDQKGDDSSESADKESEETNVPSNEGNDNSGETNTSTTESDISVVITEPEYKSIKATVYFTPDGFSLADEFTGDLNKIFEYAKENDKFNIVIEGNLNTYPNVEVTEDGKKISLKRAEIIKSYFVEMGLDGQHITIIDNYNRKPLVKEGRGIDFKPNRRADVYLIKRE